MNEKRANWKASVTKEAQERNKRIQALLIELAATREAISKCGCDYARYDEIKAQQRYIAAQLATL